MFAVPSAAGRHDRATTRLAELDAIRDVLARAGDTLDGGWVQDDWSAPGGVCLVTSIRNHSTGQLRARCLDVVWHARYDAALVLGAAASPAVRLARVRDLTRWNDHPGRSRAEVLDLLAGAGRLAADEMARLRAGLGHGRPGTRPDTRVTRDRSRASIGA